MSRPPQSYPDSGITPPHLEDAEERAETTEPKPKFFIAGIGASAGGLEALSELFKHVPIDSMAYVVVQHLAPQHESALPQLLGRVSQLAVVTAADGMAIEPNRVYVIPPNTDLAVLGGALRLIAPAEGHAPRLPIDFFLRSLADDQGSSAVGIILSGTGTDGTFGLKAIKAAGGLTFVQELSSAKYDGMPRSALASGCADFCLTPKAIAAELTRISRQGPPPRALGASAAPPPAVQKQLAKLFVLVRSEFGTDLSGYKPVTLERRIDRRMTLHRIERLEDYVTYVQSNREELAALYDDMLITVTSFFRDHDPFDALKTKVFPEILRHKDGRAPIRIWVPACATGEEAYSIAIILLEFLGDRMQDTQLQIFGTDIDEQSIQRARAGVYPQNIALDVSSERLARFFVKRGDEYVISRRVRELVVFSKQDILRDPPFSRLDLVSCRNLLIYLLPETQKRVLHVLNYSLNPHGFLLLGSSETVGGVPELFALVDKKNKIYSKKQFYLRALPDVGSGPSGSRERPQPMASTRPTASLQSLADRKVLELYGPPGVLINERLEILQFRGHTGPYLDPVPGAASFNILRLARPDLHIELKRAIERALSDQIRVTAETMFQDEGRASAVKLEVLPIAAPDANRCLLVLFHRVPPPVEPASTAPTPAPGSAEEQAVRALTLRIQELERELAVTKEHLQRTLEDQESASEALNSANEELQSSNEELQSINEELETSKEEMQSTNEELTTVNDELHTRMAELSQTNDDLHNVLAGIDQAVVIVGMDLRIRRYTVAAEKLFNLVPGDLGRTVSALEPFLGSNDIGVQAASVIESLSSVEREILASNHRWYALRITPYKTLDHAIRGAVIALADVDVRKRLLEVTRNIGEYAGKFLGGIGHPLLIVDAKLRILWANEPFYELFQVTSEETVGSLLPKIGTGQWADSELRELLERTLATGEVFRDVRIRHQFQEIGNRQMKLGGSRLPLAYESPLALLSIAEDLPAPPVRSGAAS